MEQFQGIYGWEKVQVAENNCAQRCGEGGCTTNEVRTVQRRHSKTSFYRQDFQGTCLLRDVLSVPFYVVVLGFVRIDFVHPLRQSFQKCRSDFLASFEFQALECPVVHFQESDHLLVSHVQSHHFHTLHVLEPRLDVTKHRFYRFFTVFGFVPFGSKEELDGCTTQRFGSTWARTHHLELVSCVFHPSEHVLDHLVREVVQQTRVHAASHHLVARLVQPTFDPLKNTFDKGQRAVNISSEIVGEEGALIEDFCAIKGPFLGLKVAPGIQGEMHCSRVSEDE